MIDFNHTLTLKQQKFINAQPIFFVATSPKDGRINISPKGMTDTFAIINEACVAYLDFVGSGNETAAHILNDGRMTIMMNSFTRVANIMRLYGKGRFAIKGSDEFNAHIQRFPEMTGVRQIIFLDIESIQDSCGYGVPVMELTHERDTLSKWSANKSEEVVEYYKRQNNVTSIDGLPTGVLGD